MIEELVISGKQVHLCWVGLDSSGRYLVWDVAVQTMSDAKRTNVYALNRCTFFADPGYDALCKAIQHRSTTRNPRIEGADKNPFDQHYWVAFDLLCGDAFKTVVIDPILRYIGLQEEAYRILERDNLDFYQSKRIVVPHTAIWNGGVRIKTIGI